MGIVNRFMFANTKYSLSYCKSIYIFGYKQSDL